MLSKKLKKLKWMIILGLSALIVSMMLISAIIASFTAVITGGGSSYGAKKKSIDINSYNSNVETFQIQGTFNGKYSFTFLFEDWSISGISGNGEISQNVSIPKLEGTNEEIIYQYLRKQGYRHTGTCSIMACIRANSGYETSSISQKGYGIVPWVNFYPPYDSGRETDVRNYLRANGYNTQDSSQALLEAQLYYMCIEQGFDEVRDFCKSSDDMESCIKNWMSKFEENYAQKYFPMERYDSIYNRRLKIAEDLYEKYKNYNFAKSDSLSEVHLDIQILKEETKYTFTGKLDGTAIAGTFYVSNGEVTGVGYYGIGARPDGGGEGAFTGVDDTKTAMGVDVIASAKTWTDPFNQGYDYLCEGWVARVYSDAGYFYPGSCCAASSRDKNAKKSGLIPAGAVIYSGGSYNASVLCNCGRDAGHVSIYIGNNLVAGSQKPFIMTLDDWVAHFGYGGWYFGESN